MLSPVKAHSLSVGVFAASFLISLLLGESFGFTQMVMGVLTGLSPLGVDYLYNRTKAQSDADKAEVISLKTHLQSLEADISRINLALKLTN